MSSKIRYQAITKESMRAILTRIAADLGATRDVEAVCQSLVTLADNLKPYYCDCGSLLDQMVGINQPHKRRA